MTTAGSRRRFYLVRGTRDQQVKRVCEGLALGMIQTGVEGVTSGKFAIEMALSDAWSSWGDAPRFPSISGMKASNYIHLGMHRSATRQATVAAWRFSGAWITPYLIYDSWSVGEALEHLSDPDATRQLAWSDLSNLTISHLHRSEVLPANHGGAGSAGDGS